MKLRSAILYIALALSANAAHADMSQIEALRTGDMKKLNFVSDPQPAPLDIRFIDEAEAPHQLSKFQGKYIVLNFWATWCAPCRHEMPMLSNLAREMEGKPVEVVTIATGRNSLTGMKKFFEEIGVDNLPLYRDPKQLLARQMAVLGLPITVILDPDGNEIARLRGDAQWDSDSAIAILNALAAES
ncbi:TlpA disulfide reductase family protein [Actibacterium sp. 188UL27-1]|uniref:TlpA disulfide reductase family protein n=1 Tax=Actibacterium sp. 188UL27-1 TaxID=2786961 RepID=UPI00195AB3D6|nr:TlpA disulfide reductase family protein [Actibacterium sp. 188UL27-1]MBM7066320.1 TlpA family protein disulfide reductase [Actibacterium sp. 188UL27-1]